MKEFCCLNENCPTHGVRGGDNIRLRAWYGKNKDIRLLYCRVCKKKFSERQGTPLFDSRLPQKQVAAIAKHLAEGSGLRETGRQTGTDHRTAGRYALLAEDHAEQRQQPSPSQQKKRRQCVNMPRTITKPLDNAIANGKIALDKMDYMLGTAFEWEIRDLSHVRQDLTDAIEVLKNVKQIVEEYYEK